MHISIWNSKPFSHQKNNDIEWIKALHNRFSSARIVEEYRFNLCFSYNTCEATANKVSPTIKYNSVRVMNKPLGLKKPTRPCLDVWTGSLWCGLVLCPLSLSRWFSHLSQLNECCSTTPNCFTRWISSIHFCDPIWMFYHQWWFRGGALALLF